MKKIETLADYKTAISSIAGRGTLEVLPFPTCGVEIRVPLWRVNALRQVMRAESPAVVRVDVKPLSLLDHFALWRVENV